LGALFEIKYHRPRLERLKDEWSAKHPRDHGDERNK